MLFNSALYLLLFLPITWFLYRCIGAGLGSRAALAWLVLMSLVFYASWRIEYSVLILASVVVNYQFGRLISRYRNQLLLAIGITLNLGLLGFYKYAGFFVESLNAFGSWLLPVPEITLPLAISFFTFQQIAYLVDVYRGECDDYQFSHYLLFVLFFPQLIAGPIVHHREMMPQFNQNRAGKIGEDIAVGLTIISLGLFKKVVIADNLAAVADPLFEIAQNDGELDITAAWIAALSFSFQIYFDFSGYSDMAIGSARLFGIVLPMNFHSPYKASSVIDIWHRWHVTLSRFLRDYLYIPLGGNRKGKGRRYLNLMMTMVLGGLWHGAAWTFVIWGVMHGVYLCINHAWRALSDFLNWRGKWLGRLLTPLAVLMTFLAWTAAMVVFRAADIDSAERIFVAALFGDLKTSVVQNMHILSSSFLYKCLQLFGYSLNSYQMVSLVLGVSALICWVLPNTQQWLRLYKPVLDFRGDESEIKSWLTWKPTIMNAAILALCTVLSLLSLSMVSKFIYFQF